MLQSYYEDTLYPLQDKVLEILSHVETDFYLTGGTVVNRVYSGHRYSDDLDFFVNRSGDFARQTKLCYDALTSNFQKVELAVTYDSFARIFITENSMNLKIEFVNDLPYRYGDSEKSELFIRTDNIRNILSNNISALSRNEAKDVADIWHICMRLPFPWREIIEEAKKKDMWVDESETAIILSRFDVSRFESLKWRISWDRDHAKKYLAGIVQDILTGNKNSLCDLPPLQTTL